MTETIPPPTNSLVTALLTDLYQITMVYAHWKNNRVDDPAIFELFFRKNPFGGEFTIFAGLDECLKYIANFRFRKDEVEYLQSIPTFRDADPRFFDWLLSIDTSNVTVHAMKDGTICFPRIPLLMIEAPLGIGQILETTLLTLINYPSLLATNAARMVLAANEKDNRESGLPKQCYTAPICIEFGLRRAQGPDGGFTASKYSVVGGFKGTSNVQAGKHLGLNVVGTHAHSFVQAYSSLEEVSEMTVVDRNTGAYMTLLPKVLKYRNELGAKKSVYTTTNNGELAAFVAYAVAFPDSFLCLIDTYDTLNSGLLNFIVVALALDDYGHKANGVRLDSGDLSYLSLQCAHAFAEFSPDRPFFSDLNIVASNDINEDILHALNKQKHAITVYGIGTNLVTCQKQPALGCVYKLVEIAGRPRMKLSQEISKVLIPGKKKPFRLFGKDQRPILDVLVGFDEAEPAIGERILCRHPFVERKRAAVTPSAIEPLHFIVFKGGRVISGINRTLEDARDEVHASLVGLREDHLRYSNPTPYKVSVSESVFTFLHDLWQSETPVAELS